MKIRGIPFGLPLSLLACVFGLWLLAPDLRYALEGAPVELGGGTTPLRLETTNAGRHVHVRGTAEGIGGTAELGDEVRELVLLEGAPLVVLRRPDAPRAERQLEVTGRLFRGDRARSWRPAAESVAGMRKLPLEEVYVLVEGEEPRLSPTTLGLTVLLFAVLILNVLRWRMHRARPQPPNVADV